MAKVIRSVMVQIEVTKENGDVSVVETAHITVGAEEYPDFARGKTVSITLTPTQETAIINHVKNVVLPQAELAK